MVARDRLSYVLGLRLLGPFRHSEYRRLIAAVPLRNVTSRFSMERLKAAPLPI